MKLLKFLLLVGSIASVYFPLASVANAQSETNVNQDSAEETPSSVSECKTDLSPANPNGDEPSKPDTTRENCKQEETQELEIIVTDESSPFIPSSAPTYILPKSDIEKLNPSTGAEL